MTAYECYLAPGWVQVDLVSNPELAIARAGRTVVQHVPLAWQPDARRLVDAQLVPRLRSMAEAGVHVVHLPVVAMGGLRPMVTFTEVQPPTQLADGSGNVLVLRALAQRESSAELVEIGDLIAVRTDAGVRVDAASIDEMVAAASASLPAPTPAAIAAGDELMRAAREQFGDEPLHLVSRRVHYAIADPARPERLMSVQMGVEHPSTPEGAESARQAVEIFDLVMRTFRWVA